MRKKRGYHIYVLIIIFLIVLGTRLYFAFQTPTFTGSQAYFNLYQAEAIQENLKPIFYDQLSYSGRQQVFSPVYPYILGFFSEIMGRSNAFKIIPNIFISFLVFIVYAIARKISNHKNVSLLTAVFSAFIPIVFLETTNTATIYSLTIPIMFYSLFCFMQAKEKRRYVYYFIASIFVLSLISPIAFLFLFGTLLYLLLVKLEYKKQNRIETELILFSTFFVLWIEFIIFKKAFLYHGYSLIWQNIPHQILSSFFKEITIIESIYWIGLIPLLFGMYTIYRYTLKEKDRNVYLLVGFALSVFLLLWFQLLNLKTGLMFLGIILVLLFSKSAKTALNYLEKTRFAKSRHILMIIIVVLFLLTSAVPSIVNANKSINNAVSQDEIKALEWIRDNTPEDAVILSTIEEGQFIVTLAKRKDIADMNFLLVKDPDMIVDDIKIMYSSLFKTRGIKLLTDYSVDYIYFSKKAKSKFGIEYIPYIDNECFEKVYDDEIKIYRSKCVVEE